MIPAWSDARKMVRRASKLTDDSEDSDRSHESPRLHYATLQQAGKHRPTRPLQKGDSGYGSLPGAEVKEEDTEDGTPTAKSPLYQHSSPPNRHHHVLLPILSPKAATPPTQPRPTAKPPTALKPETSLASDLHTFWTQLLSSPYLSALLFCIPPALLSPLLSFPSSLTFILTFLSIIPLAWLLGMVTEELALRTSQTVGALLNATFGNAVELIVSVVALRKGLIRLVQTSLLGSVLSNLLLVLGTSFLLGGLRYERQLYNWRGAQVYASMLLLACLALTVPSAYVNAFDAEVNIVDVLDISRVTALIIFCVYLLYLYFQLITHRSVFTDEYDDMDDAPQSAGEADGSRENDGEEADGDEMEEPMLSLTFSLLLLLFITVAISLCSDLLIDSIEPVTRAFHINESFVGIILLPIVGNAAEHATAVSCAIKNKLDLSIGVAVGSSTQIALFVIPFVTLLGWWLDEPMTLNFSEFEMIVLVMSVLIVNFLVKDGESNWLLGCMLVASYTILATAFWFCPVGAGDGSVVSVALRGSSATNGGEAG